ncbi:MAG TPA: nitrilase-related carbon-nitrogen hydrolase, partial [Parvularculaceae bacterium]|nr:nitrilase-related carbon-nitrogen hydrolase [Parvularculaceae bacterium]
MAQHNENFLAACVQLRSGIDRRRNTSAALDLIAEAASKGAKLIATPEMTNIVDRDADRMFAHLEEEEGLEEIGAFAEAARAHGAWLLIGSMAVKIGQRRAAN